MKSFVIGDLRVDRLEELCQPVIPIESILADGLPPDAIARNMHWLAPDFYDTASGKAIMSIHSWIVRTRHHTILIDACMGNHKSRPGLPVGDHMNLPWIERLAEKGLRPEDIDFVMCTHLHADHVGWNTKLVDGRWVPTFPKARYLFGRTEYNYWDSTSGRASPDFGKGSVFEDSVLPCMDAGQVQLVDGGYTLDDDLMVEEAPGHTPGNALIRATSGGETGLFAGDILHVPLQVLYPDVNTKACQIPDQARTTRRRVLSECAEHGHLLLPQHFPHPYCIRVSSGPDGFQFRPGVEN